MKIEDDESVVAFAKMQVEGIGTGLERHNWMDIIRGRATDLYGATLHPAQAFTKTIVEDETGRLLYKAMKAAPGLETATSDEPDQEQTPEEPGSRRRTSAS